MIKNHLLFFKFVYKTQKTKDKIYGCVILNSYICISECRALIDVIYLVDGSDSISLPNYNKLRYAISHMIPELDLGPRKVRLGIIVFSSTVAQV